MKPRVCQLIKINGFLLRVMVKLLRSLIISFDSCLQVSVVVLLKIFARVFVSCSKYNVSFTQSEVFASLASLNPNKASRPDNLHS